MLEFKGFKLELPRICDRGVQLDLDFGGHERFRLQEVACQLLAQDLE